MRVVFFWGTSPLSWMRYATIASFRKLNLDWEIELYLYHHQHVKKYWTDSPVQDFSEYRGADYFPLLTDLGVRVIPWELPEELQDKKHVIGPSHASNFFKWSWLSENVGVYCDLDILWTSPLTDWLDWVATYDAALAYTPEYFSIGLLWSGQQPNPVYKDILAESYRTFTHTKYQSAGVVALYRLLQKFDPAYREHPWDKDLLARYDNAYLFDMDWVYPWRFNQMEEVFNKKHEVIPPMCKGIHWYAGSPIAQKYNNLITEDTLDQYDNTFTHFARRVLG